MLQGDLGGRITPEAEAKCYITGLNLTFMVVMSYSFMAEL